MAWTSGVPEVGYVGRAQTAQRAQYMGTLFRNEPTPQAQWLDKNLGIEGQVAGDLILAEVLRGFKDDRGFNDARRMLGRLVQVSLGGEELAVQAARNFRKLHARSAA